MPQKPENFWTALRSHKTVLKGSLDEELALMRRHGMEPATLPEK